MKNEKFFYDPNGASLLIDNLGEGDRVAVFETDGTSVKEIFNETVTESTVEVKCEQGAELVIRVRNLNMNRLSFERCLVLDEENFVYIP